MDKIPVFDIGDTLIPCYRIQKELIDEFFRINGQEFSGFEKGGFQIYKPEVVGEYLERNGLEDVDAERIVEEYKRREERFLEHENIYEKLKKCSENFGQVGFISDNTYEGKNWFDQLLEQNNVKYSGFVVSEEVGVEKPDSKIFQEFLDRRERPAEDFVYIGNHVEKDKAARDVGMSFIWMKGFETFESDYEGISIDTLDTEKIRKAIEEVSDK